MAEGYKIGDVYRNEYSFLKYEIKAIEEEYVEVDIIEHDTVIAENQIIQKPYFDSKIYEGVLTKVENVPCGTKCELYKIGDMFKNKQNSFEYKILYIYDEYVEVNIFDTDKQLTFSNRIFEKNEFDSRISDGIFYKIETVKDKEVDNVNIFDVLKVDGSTIQLKEMVNHPSHYNTGKYEVIDVIEDWELGFALGNAIKYIARCEHKGNKLQDLKKSLWYIQHEIDKIEKGGVQ